MFYTILLLLYMTHSSLPQEYYKGTVDYHPLCFNNEERWSGPVCLEDGSGFFKMWCDWYSKPNNPKPFTKCTKGKKCACDGYPKFPEYGLLTYTGYQYGDDDGPYKDPFNGTTAKDESGRYYNEYKGYEWAVYEWKTVQKFQLILPKDGGFVKYSGRRGNRNCRKTVTSGTGGALFQTYNYYTMYKKISDVHRGDNYYIQKWYHEYCDNEDFCDDATYTFLYNKATQISIPLNYTHFHQYDSADRTDFKKFVYDKVIDQSIFDVRTYCTEFS